MLMTLNLPGSLQALPAPTSFRVPGMYEVGTIPHTVKYRDPLLLLLFQESSLAQRVVKVLRMTSVLRPIGTANPTSICPTSFFSV